MACTGQDLRPIHVLWHCQITSASQTGCALPPNAFLLTCIAVHLCSLLQGYGIGHLTWALAHWLCFAGAFFTTIVIEVTNSVGMFSSKLGFPFWLIDFMRMVALFVGGMGCPALLVFPLYLHKR